eukprot:5960626-Alexandrium_andersonii.AAC.1
MRRAAPTLRWVVPACAGLPGCTRWRRILPGRAVLPALVPAGATLRWVAPGWAGLRRAAPLQGCRVASVASDCVGLRRAASVASAAPSCAQLHWVVPISALAGAALREAARGCTAVCRVRVAP